MAFIVTEGFPMCRLLPVRRVQQLRVQLQPAQWREVSSWAAPS